MKPISNIHFLPYFDGLRGLAALVVFFGHSACSVYPALTSGNLDLSGLSFLPALARTPFSLLTAANSAVCIFFVLSGYVMSMVAIRSSESFVAISARRYLRLAGPAIGSCLLSAFLLKHHFYFNQSVADLTASSWLKQWFLFDGHYQTALKEGLLDIFKMPNSTYNSSLWTMYVELWGSLTIFSIIHLVKNKNLRLFSFVLATVLAGKIFHKYEFYCIFAGAVSFHVNQLFNFQFKKEWINTFCVFIGVFLCSYPDFAPRGNGGVFYNWAATRYFVTWYHALGGILIVHFIHNSNLFRKFFSFPLFLWLGKISFSLYLIHLPIICSLGAGLIAVSHNVLSYNQMTFIVILSTAAVSLSLAQIYEKTVDSLFIRTGHRMSRIIDRFFPAIIHSTETAVPALSK